MGEHTATPWDYFVGNANGRGLIRVEAGNDSPEGGHHIASMPRGSQSEANAAFIVEAVNSYDRNRATIIALVGALEQAKSAVSAAFEQASAEYHDNWTKQDKCDALIRAWRSQADSALLLARGSEGDE